MESKYDVILVLGRGISPTGELPASAQACVRRAVELYGQNIAPHIIMSGKWYRGFDYTPPITEAKAMEEMAVNMGVPQEAISIEDLSLDTISNFYYIKTKFLIPHHWRRIALLTLPELGARPIYLMNKIFGSEFVCKNIDVNFHFPTEKETQKIKEEQEKLTKLKDFLKDVKDGDHETIFQMHLEYVAAHN